ncbi:Uncharacterized protein TCM_033220 [Theobroma cacao]|uniref:Uncharacterized protein n=1 Tax=Theobroma cacao TaxID=3641 RepID=A0A061FAX0_THECC|nr:Uncharacterized protein TCM_033220 [Theobroma cacao]
MVRKVGERMGQFRAKMERVSNLSGKVQKIVIGAPEKLLVFTNDLWYLVNTLFCRGFQLTSLPYTEVLIGISGNECQLRRHGGCHGLEGGSRS